MLISAFNKIMSEEDKILHIQYSAGIMIISCILLPIIHAFIFTFLVGLLKECWDHYYGTGFCLYDMLANMVGALGSAFLITIVVFLF